jgi:sugar-specific transcriptional regulator TrmB
MQQIKSILKNIGLTDTECSIYLTALPYSSIGVRELEKQTQIKRTTIYHALNTLMEKGLVSKVGVGSRLEFSATKPENIKRTIDKNIEALKYQKQELESILPLLEQRTTKDESKVSVSHYEGIEGMKLVVEEALYCKSRQWDIIAPYDNFFREFTKEYAKYYLSARKQRGIKSRSLWEKKADARALMPEEVKERAPRYLPEVMNGKFKSVIIVFDDKVAFISSLNELSAVLIQSKEMHDTIAAMFEGLWSISRDYYRQS